MEDRELHLRDYIKVVQKRRHTVITFFIVVFLIVVVGTFSTRPLYMSSTKLLIDQDQSKLLMNANYSAYDPVFYETQFQLIKSTAVARKVVELLNLDKGFTEHKITGPSFLGGIVHWFSGLFSSGKQAASPAADDAQDKMDGLAKAISANIDVKPVRSSKIVEIRYIDSNPERACAITNTLAQAYIEELLEFNMSSTRYALQWMSRQAEEERKKLDQSEQALQDYVKERNIVTLENKVALVPQKLAELNSQLIIAETKKKQLEIVYDRVKDLGNNVNEAETISAIASDPSLQAVNQQILSYEQNINDLAQKYGAKHPIMIRAVEDLAIIKAKREAAIKRIIASIKNDFEMANANVATLNRFLGATKSESQNVNEKFVEYSALNREVETNRQFYDALMKKMKEESITEKAQTVNVMVVEKAEIPKIPAKPRKMYNLILGLIVGLFGGVGMAFFVEYIDNTVKSPEGVETKLGLPVLGVISLNDAVGSTFEGIVVSEPTSQITEGYKGVRTSLLLSSPEKPPKKILVTSMKPEEGKTSTAINLAMAIAQADYKVLLVDADLRKPRIHQVFGLSNTKGLSTYLAGASDLGVLQQGPLPNLSVLTSGPIPPNPSELLSSSRMNEMLTLLSEKYDIVICDSPPLLSVADALVLSKMVESSIIVARAGNVTYEELKKGLKSLYDLKAHVLGLVINAVDLKKDSSYYYYRHSYKYSSSAQEERKK